MRFLKWIEAQGGPHAVARMIETESPTVKLWMNGKTTPRAIIMVKLVKLGRGAFDFEDIIRETKFKKPKTRKKK